MLFIASKLLWLILRPSAVLVLIALLGLVVRRLRGLLTLSVAALTVILLAPIDQLLLRPLENRFPAPSPPPERVDGIIVLGGAVDTALTAARHRPTLNDAAERMTELLPLSRRYPDARLVFAGGSGAIVGQALTESDVARQLFEQFGIPQQRITYEDRSRTTHENAVFARELVSPQPRDVWLLVTSASHMPRAVGAFRGAGWPVIAWPVAYKTLPDMNWSEQEELGVKLAGIDWALHEYAGLIVYHLLGWTDAWFPSP